jgi:hypothetical protein
MTSWNRRSSSLASCLICSAVVMILAPGARAGEGGGKGGRRTPEASRDPTPGRASPAGPQQGIAFPNAVRPREAGDLNFGEPLKFHNLTLVPVSTMDQGPFDQYTLLETGLAQKTLEVRELAGKSGEAQVSAVEVKNSGAHSVYLLGGEMILGGKQDRIIERDTVIPPGHSFIKVAVFCVEQGRWRGQNMKFASGQAMADLGVRQAALSGDQSRVWAEVAKKNQLHGTQNATSTYRRTIQKPELRAQIAPLRRRLLAQLPRDGQLSGFVFAINGQIRAADLLGNPVLYRDLQEKLLSAYILEALGHQVLAGAPVVNAKAAGQFVGKARAAAKVKVKGSGSSLNYKLESDLVIGSETLDGRTGKKVRETYFGK